MDVLVLEAASTHVSSGLALWVGPILVSLGLIVALTITARGMVGTRHVTPPGVPAPHRGGPVKGGFFEYSPGVFSHMRPPEER